MPEPMIGTDGAFTPEFTEALPGFLGEEHKDSKDFDDIKDIGTLVKRFADNRKMVGKKLDNVIQRPADNATDDAKAEFRNVLLTELGAPEKVDGYSFDRPNLPEGMEYSDETEKHFRELFHKLRVPADTAKQLAASFNEMQIAKFSEQRNAAKKESDEQGDKLKIDWPGELFSKNARIAYKAIQKFMDDDALKTFDEAQIFDHASDLDLWDKLGIGISQLRVWHSIGESTLDAKALTNEGGGGSGELSQYEKNKKRWPKSESMWGPKDA